MLHPSPIDQFRRYLAQTGKSPHTTRAYLTDVSTFAQWFEQTTGEVFHPQAIDSRDIIEFRGLLLRRGAKPATVNRRLIALRRFCQWAKRQQLATQTPFEILDNVAVKGQRDVAPRWLDRTEQLSLLRAVRKSGNRRDYAVIQTLLGAGLRISELAGLRMADVAVSERSGQLRVYGKGNKERRVPLDSRTRQAIAAYLQERDNISAADDQPKDGEYLFRGQRGRLDAPGINYLVRKYAYQARLDDVTSHSLRHTFAKNLIDAGVPLDQVATLLGHESVDTTKIYTRPDIQDLERAVRRGAGELT